MDSLLSEMILAILLWILLKVKLTKKRIQIQRFDLYDFKGLEKNNGKTLDILVQENFYRSLGMNNTSFNPLESLIKIESANRNGLIFASNFTRLC
jgi:hypothetical protein